MGLAGRPRIPAPMKAAQGIPAVPAWLSSPGIGSSRREGAWSLFNVSSWPSPAHLAWQGAQVSVGLGTECGHPPGFDPIKGARSQGPLLQKHPNKA